MNRSVEIEKQDHFGNGVTKINDKVTFIEGVLPNEICEIKVIEEKKNFQRGIPTKIIKESCERVEPLCPYYKECGGCQLQHQSYEGTLRFKENKVRELLDKYAHYKGAIEPIISGNSLHYRNKVTLRVNNHSLCFYEEKSNHPVKIEQCLLLPEEMNKLLLNINNYLKENKEFKEIQIRMNNLNEFQIAVTGKLDLNNFMRKVKDYKVKSIYVNHVLVNGSSFKDSILGTNFYLSDTSFFQVNRYLTGTLYELVLEHVKRIKPLFLLDLYCGTGTIGLLASKYAKNVIGVEVVPSAIESANKNKKELNIDNIKFYQGRVEDIIDSIKECDFIIVDPPRSGLDMKTKNQIKKILPETICYVSCDPVTLSRDLNDLVESYKVEKITPVDMFPYTYHVETVALLTKK